MAVDGRWNEAEGWGAVPPRPGFTEAGDSFRDLVESAPIAFLRTRVDGQILMVNPALARLLGHASPAAMIAAVGGRSPGLYVDPAERERGLAQTAGTREWVTFDTRLRRADGQSIEGSITVRRVLDPQGEPVLEGFFEDVTERRRAERERDQMFHLSGDLFLVAGLDGYVRQWNPSVERLMGWSPEELRARPYLDFVHPDDRGGLLDNMLGYVHGSPVLDVTCRLACKDGSYRWISWNSYPAPSGDAVFSVGRDVTAQREHDEERARLETQLRHSQKMEGIGRLAGGIAHDFNNILAVILSYASFVKSAVEELPAVHADAVEIERAASRAAELTRQLLAFSRKSIVNPSLLDVLQTLSGLEKMIQRIVGEDITLTIDHPDGLWLTRLDPSWLDQIILNLVVNARDAMPVGGRLLIETANATEDEVRRLSQLPPRDYVRITVADTGTGMPPEVMEHLFEPFFTTKKEGKGTGLGLATVYGIVRQSGGYIFVESTAGRGSRFTLSFPRAAEDERRLVRRPTGQSEPVASATVLVVDDEPALRKIAVRALSSRGYTVIEAASGADALARADDHPGTIDVVVTDVIMPGMNGRQLVERLRARRPTIAALFMSGYTDDTIHRHGIDETEVHFLQKPFTPRSLLAALARMVRFDPLEPHRPGEGGPGDTEPPPSGS